MSAFDLGRLIEEEGWQRLAPLLRSVSDEGALVRLEKGALVPMLQETIGDAILNCKGSTYSLELKTEQQFTGNLYLETWSNRNFDPRNPGWMFKSKADVLWTYFVDRDELYSVGFRKLWHWAFEKPSKAIINGTGRIFDFPEKLQGKYVQRNKTCGRCVPLTVIAEEVGYLLYNPTRSLRPVELQFAPSKPMPVVTELAAPKKQGNLW